MRRNVLILLALFAIVITVLGSPALIGATYATSENQIQSSGTPFHLYRKPDQSVEIKNGSQDPIFYYKNWEPGFVQLEHFTLTCEDAGAGFSFSFQITTDPQQLAQLTALANVIDVYFVITDTALSSDRDAALAGMKRMGTLAEIMNATSSPISSTGHTGSVSFAVALRMSPSAGNDYQKLSLLNDPDAPFHVTVVAQTN